MNHNRNLHAVSRKIPGSILRGLLLAVVGTIILLSLAGCGESASEKAKSIGKLAVTAVDDYLDGKATYKEASADLDSLYEQMDYVDSMDQKDKHFYSDYSIQVKLLLLRTRLLGDDYNGDADSYSDLIETRNELASLVGAKKR